MNIDQRALQDGSSVEGHENDSPTYRILHNPTSTRLEVSCCEKNNPPSSTVVVGTEEGSKSSDDLENENDKTQNVKTTSSDNVVGDDEAKKKQDDTLTLRFIEESNIIGMIQERKQ